MSWFGNDPDPPAEPLLDEETEEEKARKEARKSNIIMAVVASLIIVLVLVLFYVFKDPLTHAATAATDAILDLAEAMGPAAPVLFCFLCWITTSVSGPAFIWEVSAGALFAQMYGPTYGLLVGMLSCGFGIWLGCITVFVLGQKFLKPKVQHVIDENPMLKIINMIIEEEGWQFAFVMRLNPLIPFEALNLACSVTNLSLFHHAIASIGTMPVVCFEVYTAVTASALASSEDDSGSELVEALVKLGIGALLIVGMAWYAKIKYDKKKAELSDTQSRLPESGTPASEISVKSSFKMARSMSKASY